MRDTTPASERYGAGGNLVSYVLGELDSQSQVALEKRMESEPALRDELAEIREHVQLHQNVRKVAPRRGSFERLRHRMKRDGAFDGAIPGVHCMLRRSFVLSMIFGAVAIALLIAFTGGGVVVAPPDVIGEIVYTVPGAGQRLEVTERARLQIREQPYDTGSYDAFIWLPTGVSNTYSSIEAAANTSFLFKDTRRMQLIGGSLRGLKIQPGGVGEGAFMVETPHCSVQVDEGSLSIYITPDGAETRVTVARGSARVFALDAERGIPVMAGYCTSTQRGKLPDPARPVLKLTLAQRPGTVYQVDATLRNDGYEPITIRKAISKTRPDEPIYLLHITHASEYVPDEIAENVTLPPTRVSPIDASTGDHGGEGRLEPGSAYQFTFDPGPMLRTTPRVTHWLRLEYRGDLYGPPGEARVNIASNNLKLDLRNR